MKNLIRILASAVCLLTACSEHNFNESKTQSPITVKLNENLALLGTAVNLSYDQQKSITEAKNITPLMKKTFKPIRTELKIISGSQQFEDLVDSVKDIDNSKQSSDFNHKFKKDLKKYHKIWHKNSANLIQ